MEENSTRTCSADSHHHWLTKSQSRRLLWSSLGKHHYRISLFSYSSLSICYQSLSQTRSQSSLTLYTDQVPFSHCPLFQVRQYKTLLILKSNQPWNKALAEQEQPFTKHLKEQGQFSILDLQFKKRKKKPMLTPLSGIKLSLCCNQKQKPSHL